MKSMVLLALVGMPLVAGAAETVLTCTTIDESEEAETVTIRFDEEAGTFDLLGRAMWSVKRDNDGAAKVKEIEFTPDAITVKFKRRSALWLSLGAAAASGGRVGVLDRVAGTWSLGSRTFQCTPVDANNRQF